MHSPARLPMPVEVSRIVGGTPLRPAHHEHGSSTQSVDAHTCSMRDCAVVKAMETIEVLEHILTFVPSRQIVLLQMVNKTWRLLINNSPQLYPHLFIEPRWRHPAKAFRLLHLTTMPGLSIKRGDSVHLGQWVEARMSLAAAQKIADLKSNDANFQNTADLLITQPPLRAISAFVYGSKKTPKAHSKMFCDAGITLDFMADVAQVVLKNNKHGDNAESVFKAIISFGVQSDAAPRMRSTTRTVTKVT